MLFFGHDGDTILHTNTKHTNSRLVSATSPAPRDSWGGAAARAQQVGSSLIGPSAGARHLSWIRSRPLRHSMR